jgi:Skp family chaperone for outer membrane proteins
MFASEALTTISELNALTDSDWAAIQLPTGVKRKIRTYLENLNNEHKNNGQNNQNFSNVPQTNKIPSTSPSQNTEGIMEAYERGKNETAALYMEKVKELKAKANEKFSEQNEKMAKFEEKIYSLNNELQVITTENQRNKEIVRQYVEKNRQQQLEQQGQVQELQKQLQIEQDKMKKDLMQEKIGLLEAIYMQFSSQVNNNDILDGQQINKILKDVLKNLATK